MKTLNYVNACIVHAKKVMELQQTSVKEEKDANKRYLNLGPEQNKQMFLNLFELEQKLEWIRQDLEKIKNIF